MATVSEIIFKLIADSSKMTEGTNEANKSLQTVGDTFKNVGKTMGTIGSTLTKTITAPVVGLTTALVGTGVGYKSFKENSKAAFTTFLGSAEAAQDHMDAMMDFAKTTPFSFPALIKGSQNMTAFGVSAEDNIPILKAIGDQVIAIGGGNQQVEDLAGVFARISSQGKITGQDLQSLSAYGIDAVRILANDAGVSVDEMRKRISKGAIDSEKAFDVLVKGMQEGSDGINGATVATGGSMEEMSGTWSGALDSMKGAWRRAGDAILSEELFAKLTGSLKTVTQLINSLPQILAPVVESLSGLLIGLIDRVSELADWFLNLDPGIQQVIVKFGLFAVALGPILVGTGKLITTIGSTINAFTKVASVVRNAGGIIAFLSNPIGISIAAIAALVAGGVLLYKNWDTIMEKLGPFKGAFLALTGPIGLVVGAIKLFQEAHKPAFEAASVFTDEVSKSTQKAVGAYLDMEKEATVALKQLVWSQGEVTDELAESLTAKYQEMGASIISAMKETHKEQIASTEELLATTSTLTDKEKEAILKKENDFNANQIEIVEDGTKRIEEILTKASDEKRALTEAEATEIGNIQRQMQETAIKTMTESEAEQKVIFERIKASASELSAEQAAEVVKNSVEQKNKVIAEADQMRDKSIAEIIRMRDETGSLTEEQAQKAIEEAERMREETVKNAEDMHQNVVSEAEEQAGEHAKWVDWETGEILTKWEKFKVETGDKLAEMKKEGSKLWTDFTTDLKNGAIDLKDSVTGFFSELGTNAKNNWEDMKKDGKKLWGEYKNNITDDAKRIKDNTVKFFTDMGTNAKKIFEDMKKSGSEKITQLKTDFTNKAEEIRKKALEKFEAARKAIVDPITKAKDKVKELADGIVGFFTGMKISLPSIKMPHFKIKNWSLNPANWVKNPPSIAIEWYAAGGFFDEASIIGVGEKGSEAVLPLVGRRMDPFADAVFKRLEENLNLKNSGDMQESHVHYWQINADEISDVTKLIDMINGIVQTVRSR